MLRLAGIFFLLLTTAVPASGEDFVNWTTEHPRAVPIGRNNSTLRRYAPAVILKFITSGRAR